MPGIPIKTFNSLQETASLIKQRNLRHLGPSSGDELSDWWFDLIEEYFSCRQCGQVFHLEVEAYHGSGGALEPSSETVESVLERFATSKAIFQQIISQQRIERRHSETYQSRSKFGRTFVNVLVHVSLVCLGVWVASLVVQLFSR
ncbi:MAG TPA: hypothetical protein IGS53_22385 [Leptolyngbyaceae cyanobacterium M33_DOE_097]|uniref:Uncharacterized protein n=1 Tax=Oscillatoriales cyanobacterium SpSt-418 TaxID=2282169 RepID=A0A7C3KCT5_9CYAN|nr:hypothetical protein [Leptolyngbyaceae cyanobacterium M33_DOE_097]